MSFRIASTTQQRQSLLDLQRTQERLVENQTRITSGSRITGPGDDPTASASILDFNNSIQANTQSIKQADTALSYLTSSEDAVTAAISATMRLQELAVGGSTASIPELEAIRSNLLALGNTQSQGKYLFAGTNTGTPPFTNTVPPTYVGTLGPSPQGDINLQVTSTTSVTTNVLGNKVFFGDDTSKNGGGPSDIFQAISDLEAAFNGNSSTQTVQTNLGHVLDNLNSIQSTLGGRQAGLTTLKDTLSNFNNTLDGLQNNLQATDYPTVATQFSADQTMQSATLSTMAKTGKASLFDYLT